MPSSHGGPTSVVVAWRSLQRRRYTSFLVVSISLLLPAPALAQRRPLLAPTRGSNTLDYFLHQPAVLMASSSLSGCAGGIHLENTPYGSKVLKLRLVPKATASRRPNPARHVEAHAFRPKQAQLIFYFNLKWESFIKIQMHVANITSRVRFSCY